MAAPPAKISKSRLFTRRLHVGLYVRVVMMISLGGIIATVFEQYSVADFRTLLKESQRRTEAADRGEKPAQKDVVSLREAFKPLERDTAAFSINEKKAAKADVAIQLGSNRGWWTVLLILIWFWPLYRYYFSSKPQNLLRVERRIVDWPIFIFGLCWLVAAVHYFSRMATYREQYGDPDLRVLTIFATGALIFGAFTVYLNLELTQRYVRKWIAQPFFREHNPYGLRQGVQIGLTARYLLLLFSLATVPVLLLVYIPAEFNWELLTSLSNSKSSVFFENAGVLVPLLMATIIACVILFFQALSILLFRSNVQRPIRALIGRMRQVAAGDLNCKTSVLDSDEVGQLKGHFNLMLDGLHERERIKDMFGRYVSVEVAKKVINSGANLEGEEVEATVLFADIRGFTARSQAMPATELVRFLNAYLSHVTAPIEVAGGVIDKFIGDGVMAIFSPVFGLENHAPAAVRAALGIRAAVAEFNRTGGFSPVTIGVGLHRGRVIAGNVGTVERTEYTVLGDVVNVASRIEGHTKESNTDLLMSAEVLAGLDQGSFPEVNFLYFGPVLLRGKTNAIELYRPEARVVET